MPQIRRLQPYNQVLNMWSFWIMVGGMAFMTFTLTFAGVVQTHMQRVLGEDFMQVQGQLDLFYMMRLGSGSVVALGVVLFLISVFGPARGADPELRARFREGQAEKGNNPDAGQYSALLRTGRP